MHEVAIPVDLRNPGQVFACIGFAEACEAVFNDHCEIRFNYEGPETVTRCSFFTERLADPIFSVLEFLQEAKVTTILPVGHVSSNDPLSTKKWGVVEVDGEPNFSPSAIPSTPATLPIEIRRGAARLSVSHWADGPNSGRDNVKFWAGAGGKPGSAIARDMLLSIAAIPAEGLKRWAMDPFSLSAPMTGGFRFDWRRDYISLDAGFSPNSHEKKILMVGFPITELLAAVGLQYARPIRVNRDKLRYRYAVSSTRLPLSLIRPILGDADLGFPKRTFAMVLGWPGKAGHARCIVDAREES
jgi:CRISPR-associated protein Csx14